MKSLIPNVFQSDVCVFVRQDQRNQVPSTFICPRYVVHFSVKFMQRMLQEEIELLFEEVTQMASII